MKNTTYKPKTENEKKLEIFLKKIENEPKPKTLQRDNV
jgi:hypothetical protein